MLPEQKWWLALRIYPDSPFTAHRAGNTETERQSEGNSGTETREENGGGQRREAAGPWARGERLSHRPSLPCSPSPCAGVLEERTRVSLSGLSPSPLFPSPLTVHTALSSPQLRERADGPGGVCVVPRGGVGATAPRCAVQLWTSYGP